MLTQSVRIASFNLERLDTPRPEERDSGDSTMRWG
jgi:hypothetical protein